MKIAIVLITVLLFGHWTAAQTLDIPKVKKELENSADPVGYIKNTLKKKYKVDTVPVYRLSHFMGLADSLAYYGKVKKVYGPFPHENILVQIVGKAPNTFYRATQLLIDTSVFKKKVADSLANVIIRKLKAGTTDFESLSRIYSTNGSQVVNGDMGWTARGSVIPAIEKAILSHKKGDIFKVWTKFGLHIIQVTETQKEDTGFALMLRVFL